MDISELLNGPLGSTLMNSISEKFGMGKGEAQNTVKAALPEILNGLHQNAKTEDGAASLQKALESKHDGSLLDNLGDMLSGNSQELEQDGGNILGHIFGSNKDDAAQLVSKKAGVSSSTASSVMSMLAPVIMAYLGRQKTQNNVNAGGLGDLIGNIFGGGSSSGSSGGGVMGMLNSMFDKDGDGSAVDDILGMFTKK